MSTDFAIILKAAYAKFESVYANRYYRKKKKKKKTSALKFSVKLSSTNMGFVNYSSLTLSPDFQNTERLSRGVLQK